MTDLLIAFFQFPESVVFANSKNTFIKGVQYSFTQFADVRAFLCELGIQFLETKRDSFLTVVKLMIMKASVCSVVRRNCKPLPSRFSVQHLSVRDQFIQIVRLC